MATYAANTTLAGGTNPTNNVRSVDEVEEITADSVTVQVPADPSGDRRDFVLACQTIGVTAGGGPDSRWILNDCTVMMDTGNNHRFKQGFLEARRARFLLMEDIRLVWPANAVSNAGVGFEFDLTDAYFAAKATLTGTNGFVVHFGGANANGTLITAGIVFGPGAFPQNIPHISWVNTTFGNNSSEAAGGFSNYFRFVDADAGMGTLQWSGLFGCDLTAWQQSGGDTEEHIGVFACPWEADLGSRPLIFLLNCSYDGAVTAQRLYQDNSNVNDGATWVSGQAWKATFGLPDGTDRSANYRIDFASDDVYDMQASRDQTTAPTLHSSAGGINVQDFRTDGWAIVEQQLDVIQVSGTGGDAGNYNYTIDVAVADRNLSVYSYEDETWGTDGVALTVTTTASPFDDALTLGTATNYVFPATAQTSIDKATAELLRAGTNVITTLDDLVAAARKDGFDNAIDLIIYSANPSGGAVTVPSGVELSDTGGALSVAAGTTEGNFGALAAGTQYDTITGDVVLNSNMPTLGAGLTIDGNLTVNSEMDLSDLTVTGDIRVATGLDSSLNWSNVTWGGNLFNDSASNTLAIVPSNGTSGTTTEGGTGNGQVDIQEVGVIAVVDGTTYTEDADNKFVVDTDTVSTFTISGFTPKEIQHIGSGSTTILGTNNAKLTTTTITATGGTLVLGDGLNPSSSYSVDVPNRTITLTTGNTETDLLGLRGLDFVDYRQTGNFISYTFKENVSFVVDGTLSHEPDSESLTIQYTEQNREGIMFAVNGAYYFGTVTTVDGKQRFSAGVGLTFIGNDDSALESAVEWGGTSPYRMGLQIAENATFVSRGGIINSNRVISFGLGNSGTNIMENVDIQETLFVKNGTDERREFRIQSQSSGAGTLLGRIDGFQISHRSFPDTFSPALLNAQIVQLNNGAASTTIRKLDTSSNINDETDLGIDDFSTEDGAERVKFFTVVGSTGGSNTRTMPKSGVGDDRQKGGSIIQQPVSFNFKDTDGANMQGVKLYLRDTDNGFRKNANGQNHIADKVYQQTSDASGDVAEFSVVTAVTNIDTEGAGWAYTDWDTTAFSNRYKVDRRSLDDSGDDIFRFRFVEYGSLLSSTDIALLSLDTVHTNWIMVSDPLITESSKAAVDAYVSIDTTARIYDYAKAVLVDTYAGETETLVGREGTALTLGADSLVVDASAGQVFDKTGTVVTILSANFTGGVETSSTITQANGATLTDLVLTGGATWNVGQSTWTGSAASGVTLDVATGTSFDATGFTFDAASTINNSTGGAIDIAVTPGQQVPLTTGDTINFVIVGIDLTFNSLDQSTVEIFDDSGVSQQRYTNLTGSQLYAVPDGSTGTWSYVVDREGYAPLRGTFAATGTDVTVDATLTPLEQAAGAAMYTGTTSPLVDVSFDNVTPVLYIDIGDGSVTPQVIFDEVEQALLTMDGIEWTNNQAAFVRVDNLPGVGPILLMDPDIRLRRRVAGDVNAAVSGYVISKDNVPVDGSNGSVAYVGGIQSAGYQDGRIWIDTQNGEAGSAAFVNGTADKPVSSWADALAISAATGLRAFHVNPGSSIQFVGDAEDYDFNGRGWSLDLNGQNIGNTIIEGAMVSNAGTTTGGMVTFVKCVLESTASTATGKFEDCQFDGFTMTASGKYSFINCSSNVPGSGAPSIDFGSAVGPQQVQFRGWFGGASFTNIEAGDDVSLDGITGGTVTVDGTGGSIRVAGAYEAVTDASGGSVTITRPRTFADIGYVNGVLVTGDGQPGTEWGP